jgi:hypothetical protein
MSAPIVSKGCSFPFTCLVTLAPTYPSAVCKFTIIMPQIIFCVSLADLFFVSEYDTDCPRSYQVSHTMLLIDGRPHHLIVRFRSCTLRVCSFSNVWLIRRTLANPRLVQPLFDEGHFRPHRFRW